MKAVMLDERTSEASEQIMRERSLLRCSLGPMLEPRTSVTLTDLDLRQLK
jgi:hypothetical protein